MDARESICLRHPIIEGVERCECPLSERDAMHILESFHLNTFESALITVEEFLANINLFDQPGDSNFGLSAVALDLASRAFVAIDANHDFLMTKKELEQYIASGHHDKSLDWLLSKFAALERLSFFKGGISKQEIEAARDFFHGMNCLKNNFEEFSKPHRQDVKGSLSKQKVSAFLDKNRGKLDVHDERGLDGLINYIEKADRLIAGV